MWLQGDPSCHRHHQLLQQRYQRVYGHNVQLRQIPPSSIASTERPLHQLMPVRTAEVSGKIGTATSSGHSTRRAGTAPVPDSEDGLLRFTGQRKASAPRVPVRPDASWIRSSTEEEDSDETELGQPPTLPPPPAAKQTLHSKMPIQLAEEELLLLQRINVRSAAAAAAEATINKKVIDWQLKHAADASSQIPADEPEKKQSESEQLLHCEQTLKQPLRRANNLAEGLDRVGESCMSSEHRVQPVKPNQNIPKVEATSHKPPDHHNHHERHQGPDDQVINNFRRVQLELQAPLRRIADRLRKDDAELAEVETKTAACKGVEVCSSGYERTDQGHRDGQSQLQQQQQRFRREANTKLLRLERQLGELRAESLSAQRRLERQLNVSRQNVELGDTAAAAASAGDDRERRRCHCRHRKHRHHRPHQLQQQQQQHQALSPEEAESTLIRACREIYRCRRKSREALARDSRSLERRCDRLRIRLGEFGRRLLAIDWHDDEAGRMMLSDSELDGPSTPNN